VSFAPGERVRVRAMYPLGHVRTPSYVRGKAGVIERVVGRFENPEQLAYGRTGDQKTLYRVRFSQRDVFPEAASLADTIDVEIYEHWLEKI
jgi:nitrile hydratase subunit beta